MDTGTVILILLNGIETFFVMYLVGDIQYFKKKLEEIDERLSYLEGKMNGMEKKKG